MGTTSKGRLILLFAFAAILGWMTAVSVESSHPVHARLERKPAAMDPSAVNSIRVEAGREKTVLRPNQVSFAIRNAKDLIRRGRYEDAQDRLDQSCSHGENDACAELEQLVTRRPELGPNRVHLAPDSLDEYKDEVERRCNSRHHRACFQLGSVYKMQGNWVNALNSYKRACEGGLNDACDSFERLTELSAKYNDRE